MARNHKLLAFIADQQHTQTSFAKAVDVDRQTVISWIDQKKSPSLSSLYKMATAFGEDPYELNEKLGLGVILSQADTEIQKLQKEFQQFKAWFALPGTVRIKGDPVGSARVNLVLGALESLELCLLDMLVETPLTVAEWRTFYTEGEIDDELLNELHEWLGIKDPEIKSVPVSN
jgi:DNA-binding XRE family transcriptional regulator